MKLFEKDVLGTLLYGRFEDTGHSCVKRRMEEYVAKYGFVLQEVEIRSQDLSKYLDTTQSEERFFIALSDEDSADARKWGDYWRLHLLTLEELREYQEWYQELRDSSNGRRTDRQLLWGLYEIVKYATHPLEAIQAEKEVYDAILAEEYKKAKAYFENSGKPYHNGHVDYRAKKEAYNTSFVPAKTSSNS